MNEELKITVYDDNGKEVKQCEATPINFRFGTVRNLIKLLQIDNTEDTYELLKLIYESWEELTKLLSECFPDMEYDDWENVELKELVPIVYAILKYAFGEILTIPQSKN